MCQALFQEVTKQIKIRCHLHYIKEKQYVIWVKYYGMKISVSREGWVIILSRWKGNTSLRRRNLIKDQIKDRKKQNDWKSRTHTCTTTSKFERHNLTTSLFIHGL